MLNSTSETTHLPQMFWEWHNNFKFSSGFLRCLSAVFFIVHQNLVTSISYLSKAFIGNHTEFMQQFSDDPSFQD